MKFWGIARQYSKLMIVGACMIIGLGAIFFGTPIFCHLDNPNRDLYEILGEAALFMVFPLVAFYQWLGKLLIKSITMQTPKTNLDRLLMMSFYPIRMHHLFCQRYSMQQAETKIDMFMEKVIGIF